MITVSERITTILRSIATLAKTPVSLVAVTKHQSIDIIRIAVQKGIQILGVNYVQEGTKLQTELGTHLEWHFIGNIQSRKVKLLTHYQCIQSLDRIEIASALEDYLGPLERSMDVLLQINIGNEPQKSGITQEKVEDFLLALKELPHLRIKGMMCLPPPLFPVESRRPFFKAMCQLYARYKKRFDLEWLSMGTSDDYSVAVQEGANMVRLGKCLFGDRMP